MRTGQYVFIAILVAACLAAVGFCLWSLLVYGSVEMAVVGSVILLALAQFASFVSRISDERHASRNSREFVQAAADLGRDVREVRRRLSQFEGQLRDGREQAAGDLGKQVTALESTVAALAARLDADARHRPPAARAASRPPRRPANDERRPAGRSSDIELYLQPVVRLATGRTAYYRASFKPAAGGPAGIGDEARFIARVVALLRHLDRKGRAVGIFCRLGPAAFADEAFLRRLVKYLQRNEDVAGKLVVEITQADLAGLSQRGMQGLAWLAELGATFALAKATPGSLDLAALGSLGFQFLDIDLASLPTSKVEVALHGLAGEAERHGLTLIAGPVRQSGDLARVEAAASLAHGRHFAPPRRVKPDFGDAEPADAAAA